MASPSALLRLYFVSGFLIITKLFFESVDICSAERYSASDQLCQFIWDNRADMTENIRHRLKRRPHKRFLRFKSPVYYLDTEGKWKQAKDEFETWVSVAYTHEYMLHFPHNFNVLSLGTMGIITDEFWGPDAKWEISGSCNKACAKLEKPRCSLSRRDIQEFVSNVTLKDKQDWNYICFQLDYDVNDVVRNPNTAIPDILYYWRFLRQLFTQRPYLVKGFSKNDFVHYHCYDEEGRLFKKHLLRKYYLIFIIAVILWLYSPLLVHYFPSSQPPAIDYPAGLNHKDFCPTFRSPVCFGGFLRCILCFHMEESKGFNLKSRIRRILFLSFFLMISFRLWYTPYQIYFVMFSLTSLVAALVPEFFSVYIKDKLPTRFLGPWKYPEGVFRENARKKEYQFLAHCMSERIYLISDRRFWEMLVEKIREVPPTFFAKTGAEIYQSHPIETVVSPFRRVVTFARVVISIFRHLLPAFHFYKVLLQAICTQTRDNVRQACHKRWAWRRYKPFLTVVFFAFHGVILAALLLYLIVAAMFCCYLLAEVTMFTYIGAVLVPTMAFKYVSLASAVSFGLYKINKDLRENYDRIRDEVVKILENSDHLTRLNSDCTAKNPEAFQRMDPTNDALLTIQLKKDPQSSKVILYRDHFATYLSRTLLDFCIEVCDPLRRQMMFICVEVLLMAFYVVIAMWMKNVFHKEDEVSSIFTIAETIGMSYVPNLLQFLAHKSHFRKKDDVLLCQRVHDAIVTFVAKQ